MPAAILVTSGLAVILVSIARHLLPHSQSLLARSMAPIHPRWTYASWQTTSRAQGDNETHCRPILRRPARSNPVKYVHLRFTPCGKALHRSA